MYVPQEDYETVARIAPMTGKWWVVKAASVLLVLCISAMPIEGESQGAQPTPPAIRNLAVEAEKAAKDTSELVSSLVTQIIMMKLLLKSTRLELDAGVKTARMAVDTIRSQARAYGSPGQKTPPGSRPAGMGTD